MGQSCSATVLSGEVAPPGTDAGGPGPPRAPPGPDGPVSWPKGRTPPAVPISTCAFALSRRRGVSGDVYDRLGEGWRRRYTQNVELGRGVSAAVYEAEASGPGEAGPSVWSTGCSLLDPHNMCGTGTKVPCLPESRRRVALKRFKRLRSRSFQTERAALLRVGVHPNVVRLLESYEDFGGEDVLVLEYCDGLTVFEAQAEARKQGDGVPELLAARLLRQVLLALEHVGACGVEHQDVKPENMLLYSVSLSEQRAELKLGDFGWAVPARQSRNVLGSAIGLCRPEDAQLPADGAGSLWYAPPELNPPVELPGTCGGHSSPSRTPSAGRADMWSVGVVAYVLLVGQNPFCAALDRGDKKAVEAEVLRLVALGRYDTHCARWRGLPEDARSFVEAMLQVPAASRPSASEALRHPFLARCLARCPENARAEPPWRFPCRDSAWARLDGFQHLCWLAVARAAAEPELSREAVLSAAKGSRAGNGGPSSYLWHLARELSAAPTGCWLQHRGAWPEVLRLAFSYLDVDGDGFLCPKDLASHLGVGDPSTSNDAWAAAHLWVARWVQCSEDEPVDRGGNLGMGPECFRAALRSPPAEDTTLLSDSELQQDSLTFGTGGSEEDFVPWSEG